MIEGRWRVSTGADGTRYLYLFKNDGDYISMSLDTEDLEEGDDGFGILMKRGGKTVADGWSPSAFAEMLDLLSAESESKEST